MLYDAYSKDRQCGLENALSAVWKTKEVKEIERFEYSFLVTGCLESLTQIRCVDKWVDQYHSGGTVSLFPFPDEDNGPCVRRNTESRKQKNQPHSTVASFIDSCDSGAASLLDENEDEEEIFETSRKTSHIAARQEEIDRTDSRNNFQEDGQESISDNKKNNTSHDTDDSIDEPVEENIFVYAAHDDGEAGTASSCFRRPRDVWKDFIMTDDRTGRRRTTNKSPTTNRGSDTL